MISDTVQQRDATAIKSLILGILTIFIIIEIFDLFREYLRSAHIKVTNLAEVSLAVVLRELWLLLLEGSTDWKLYLSLAAVVAALGGFWWLATAAVSGRARRSTPRPRGRAACGDGTRMPGQANRPARLRTQRRVAAGGRPRRARLSAPPAVWYRVLPFSGRLAQWESARLTRGRSLVQIQHRPPPLRLPGSRSRPLLPGRPPGRARFGPNAETQRRGLKCPQIGCSVAAWPDRVYRATGPPSSALPPGPKRVPLQPSQRRPQQRKQGGRAVPPGTPR